MRLQISGSRNAASYYVVKTVYENGKKTNKIHEKLGTHAELKAKLGDKDPKEWAEEYVKELNRQMKEGKEPDIIVKYSPYKRIEKDIQRLFNGGYLFLQQIYHELKLHQLCKEISEKYKFEFNLDSILSRLVYGRILFPLSKLGTFEESKKFIEQPDFKLHQIYRALEYLAKEIDFIQSFLYKNSLKISKRNTGILYYDCTNFYFEIEEEDGIKQYGASKDHKPNPIVQMGLFMDGDGIPLAFSLFNGNMNEQLTLKPLEKKILSDFELSKFVVCTDAGLSSEANRRFNDREERAFITTQSVKKLKAHLKKWALDPTGWKLSGSDKIHDISKLDEMIEKADAKGKEDLRELYEAVDLDSARKVRDQLLGKYGTIAPKAATLLDESFDDVTAILAVPLKYRKRLRTTNGVERLNQEVRRRERVIRIFPNEASVIRLIGALLMEQDEKWQAGRKYFDMDLYYQSMENKKTKDRNPAA
jgi:hypothetical protein